MKQSKLIFLLILLNISPILAQNKETEPESKYTISEYAAWTIGRGSTFVSAVELNQGKNHNQYFSTGILAEYHINKNWTFALPLGYKNRTSTLEFYTGQYGVDQISFTIKSQINYFNTGAYVYRRIKLDSLEEISYAEIYGGYMISTPVNFRHSGVVQNDYDQHTIREKITNQSIINRSIEPLFQIGLRFNHPIKKIIIRHHYGIGFEFEHLLIDAGNAPKLRLRNRLFQMNAGIQIGLRQ